MDRIYIKTKPNASGNKIIVQDESHWEVFTTASPTGGQANLQLIDLVAGKLGIAKGRVSIIRGLKSRNKVIEVAGDLI